MKSTGILILTAIFFTFSLGKEIPQIKIISLNDTIQYPDEHNMVNAGQMFCSDNFSFTSLIDLGFASKILFSLFNRNIRGIALMLY